MDRKTREKAEDARVADGTATPEEQARSSTRRTERNARAINTKLENTLPERVGSPAEIQARIQKGNI